MAQRKSNLSPLSILMLVMVVAAIATWLIPSGKYDTLSFEDNSFKYNTDSGSIILPAQASTLDSLKIAVSIESFFSGSIKKPVAVPGTYHTIERNAQGFLDVLKAPILGIMDSIDIVLFLLIMGGFMNVFHETGAMVNGLRTLSQNMKGKESWIIIVFTFLFSFGGASYGMAEEALVFYPIMVPIFLAAGYDVIVPLAVIFGGTQLGTLASFSNPFSTIIASHAAGVRWTDGMIARLAIFAITTIGFIIYIVRYANKVQRSPEKSLVLLVDGKKTAPPAELNQWVAHPLSNKDRLLLLIFLGTFLTMIAGVVFWDWWLTEMSALFLGMSFLIAIIGRMGESLFINQFIKGAEEMLAVAFIIGIARGVTIILNDGNITDSILYYSSSALTNIPASGFIVALLVLFMLFTLFIASSSGMAVLTMPIMGGLALMLNIPGREIVNAYLFGMGIMGFMTPTGLILPSLALVDVSLKAWWKFIYPFMLMLFILCILFLVVGINMK